MVDAHLSNSEFQAPGTLNRVHLSLGFLVLMAGIYLGGLMFHLLFLG
ncbi:MAG TPA: hypothetical protein VHX86_03375 [Tepidisphaeraceae bacterium]|jgi:hypothetical protein|nr:hypothetical protein [Tepidisphaeraceae bacterium]